MRPSGPRVAVPAFLSMERPWVPRRYICHVAHLHESGCGMPWHCPVPASAPAHPPPGRGVLHVCVCVNVRARRVVLDRRTRTQECADAMKIWHLKASGVPYTKPSNPPVFLCRGSSGGGGMWTAIAGLPFRFSVSSDTASQYEVTRRSDS